MIEQFQNVNWEKKVWGRVAHLQAERTSLSILELNAIACCSRHYHEKRWNRFVVLDAQIAVCLFANEHDKLGTASKFLRAGDVLDVPPLTIHRFDVMQFGRVIEVYWNADDSPVDLNDIVRLEEGHLL